MNEALLQLLPAAIGFALSPIALVEMILVLLSKKAKSNGLLFLVCIMIPVFAVPLLGAMGISAASTATESAPAAWVGWLILGFGLLLALMAWNNFKNRHDASVPKVFDTIENMGTGAVMFLSAGVTIINPKNLVVLLGAGSTVAALGLTGSELLLAIAIFTVVATLPFSIIVAYMFLGGEKAAQRVQIWKAWLLSHNRLIMAIVLGLLGLVMIGKGLTAVMA
jgi:hypothetical protein